MLGPRGLGSAQSWRDGGGASPEVVTTEAQLKCVPAGASEDLRARVDVMSLVGKALARPSGPQMLQVSDLFERFNGKCGDCHVPADAPVLDHNLRVQMGIHPERNYFAACLEAPVDPNEAQQSTIAAFQRIMPNMPFCPAGFLEHARVL